MSMSLRSALGGEDRLARSARTAAPGTATAKYEIGAAPKRGRFRRAPPRARVS